MKRREKGRINPGEKAPNQLAVSRAFGDLELKEPLKAVSAEPEVEVHELSGKERCVVVSAHALSNGVEGAVLTG